MNYNIIVRALYTHDNVRNLILTMCIPGLFTLYIDTVLVTQKEMGLVHQEVGYCKSSSPLVARALPHYMCMSIIAITGYTVVIHAYSSA